MNIVVIIYQGRLYRIAAKEVCTVWVGADKSNTLCIPEIGNSNLSLVFSGTDELYVEGTGKLFLREFVPKNNAVEVSETPRLTIFWSDYLGSSQQKYSFSDNREIVLGRQNGCDIQISKKVVSRKQMTFRMDESGQLHIEDGHNNQPSTNGTFVNGRAITETVLRDGDNIDVMYIRMRYHQGTLLFDNVGDSLFISDQLEKEKTGEKKEKEQKKSSDRPEKKSRRTKDRQRKQLPTGPVLIDGMPAPSPVKKAAFFFGHHVASDSVDFEVPEEMESPALTAVHNRIEKKKQAAGNSLEPLDPALWKKYGPYIEEQKRKIRLISGEQSKIRSEENPAPAECISLAQNEGRMLWERQPSDSDYLEVRLGMGYEPLCAEVVFPQQDILLLSSNTEKGRVYEEIREYARYADYVPYRIRLKEYQTIGMIGARDRVADTVWNLVICLSTLQDYEDVKIVGVFDDTEQERKCWDALKWLPHVYNTEYQTRMVSFGDNDITKINWALKKTGKNTSGKEPYYVILLGSAAIAEQLDWYREMVEEMIPHNATLLMLFDQKEKIPKTCSYYVDLSFTLGSAQPNPRLRHREFFIPDAAVTKELRNSFCRKLYSVSEQERDEEELDWEFEQTLPMGEKEMTEWARWKSSQPVKIRLDMDENELEPSM